MAEIKLGWLLFNWLGFPIFVSGFVINFNNPYGAVLGFLSVVWMLIKIYSMYQDARSKELDNQLKDYNFQKKKHDEEDKS